MAKKDADASAARKLVAWYRKARRPMPWRLRPGPYVCWLSEIMLQQTTYEQALPYYERFLKRFPTVGKLAAADEQDVLKAWEGLGYYARARNLLKAARRIAASSWPTAYGDWLALPGIGPYTAAALASVLDGAPTPVVDGNVARVFARYWHLEDDFKEQSPRAALARRLVPLLKATKAPGDFNQAMMELGALVCTPKAPQCGDCPLAARCAAKRADDAEAYPRVARRTAVPTRKRSFVVIGDGRGRVLLVQNADGGLLKGLWELPSVAPGEAYAQTFSHFKLSAEVFRRDDARAARFVDPSTVPLTTAARRILAQAVRGVD